MELLCNAKAVRLRSHLDKYLIANEDEESVDQERNGSCKNARWWVDFLPGQDCIIRLKSCYGMYLTASNQHHLMGMTGRKILQTLPKRLDSSVEWEVIRKGHQIKLKTRYGNYLRANGGLPPWRNSVTHDVPHRTSTQDWVLWDVDILEIAVTKSTVVQPPPPPPPFEIDPNPPCSVSVNPGSVSRQESLDMYVTSPPKSDGRTIYYHIADTNGHVEDETSKGYKLNFKGNGVEKLKQKLEEDTGLNGIYVCTRSPLNKKLNPLRLHLPPNNANMHVIIVASSSRVAREFGN